MAKKINLNSIVSKCVHRPAVLSDANMTPLYKRNDEVSKNPADNIKRSPEWIKATETKYTSPNNVKRVFITYKGVYVHLFRPIKGDKTGSLSEFYPYTSVDKEIDMVAARESKMRRDRQIIISQLGLNAIKHPWSCSNIEEIYFDWTIFLSDDIQNYGYADLLSMFTQRGTTTIRDGRILWELFSRTCLNSGEKINNTFPRLKIIGYIDNLKDVYDRVGKPRETSVESIANLWYKNDVVKTVMHDPNHLIAIYKIPNVTVYNTKFTTRSYYNFDIEVLEPYFKKLSEDITNYIRKKQGTLIEDKKQTTAENSTGAISGGRNTTEVAQKVKKVEKSEYEIALDESLPIVGDKGVYMSLKMMLNNLGKDKWLQLFRDMSDDGRIKYQTIYNKCSKGGHN